MPPNKKKSSSYLISERRGLAENNIVAHVHAEREHAGKQYSSSAGGRVLELHEGVHVVKHGAHDEHAERDQRAGVVQQLQRVAVQALLVRVGEDLGHGRRHHRENGKHCE